MKTWRALGIKLVLTLAVAAIATFFAGIPDVWLIFLVALIVTIVNYIFGDMIVLPATGNIIASISDGGIAGFLAYVTANGFPLKNVIVFAVTFGILIMAGEFFFHKYVLQGTKFSTNPLR